MNALIHIKPGEARDVDWFKFGEHGPLFKVDDVSYDRSEKHWNIDLVSGAITELSIELTDEQREELEAWYDANVEYDWSDD